MAQFKVRITNVINDNHEEILVTGCRESDASVKRNYGADEAANYDYYYVKKPNQFGIKWHPLVIILYENSMHAFII